jgi:hypothetical protein
MRVYDNSSLHELLQQMKELHEPDRCEGPLNDIWQGMQSVYYRKGLTPQQKIENYWNVNSNNHKGLLKMLTLGNSAARESLWDICKKVDSSRTPTIDQAMLNAFIDGCNELQLQKMFEIMIVQWVWRDRMQKSWNIM